MKNYLSKNIWQKLKPIFPFFPLPFILLLAFGLISVARPAPYNWVPGGYGVWDLRGYDFDNYDAFLMNPIEIPALYYFPNELLSPEEFEARAGEARLGRANVYTHATSLMRVLVDEGVWYTFSRHSADFSHRIYVNGEWLMDMGLPGASPETDTPNTGRIIFTAQGVDGVIEILQQTSNHVHPVGGSPHSWTVGTGTTLSDRVLTEQYLASIILGSFLMLALLFTLLFFTQG